VSGGAIVAPQLFDPNWVAARVEEARAIAEKYRRQSCGSPHAGERLHADDMRAFWSDTADVLTRHEHALRRARAQAVTGGLASAT